MKKGEHSRSKDDHKDKREASPRDEVRIAQRLPSVIGEIKMITRGPSTGRSFKSLKKSYQRQVNNVHKMPPMKQRRMDKDMFYLKKMPEG